MALYFEILSGPHRGEKYVFVEGTTIGRVKCTISLSKDPKASSQHARVRVNSKGQLSLLDLDSANGVKFQGKKVKKVILLPGVEFIIGNSLFKVDDEGQDAITGLESASPQAAELELNPDQAPIPVKENWLDVLRQAYIKLGPRSTDASEVVVFVPMLNLTFLEGIQADTVWEIGYGPRKFGADTLDFELEDPMTPALAFEIIPTASGPLFKTENPKIVWVNGSSLGEKILVPGDLITFGQTKIQVGVAD